MYLMIQNYIIVKGYSGDNMNNGTIEIKTDRLVLRRFEENDYQAMFDNWASDAEVAKGAGWPQHTNPEDTKELVKMLPSI